MAGVPQGDTGDVADTMQRTLDLKGLGSSRALHDFNPPRDAEPSGEEAEGAVDLEKPTVLNKLQKWADYPSVGDPVQPTRFLPMKTPMSCEILHNWSLPEPPRHSLTVPELLRGEATAGRKVGMIIDLANHDCLYADDLPEEIEYAHVQLVAKVLPPREAIDEVERVARAFWERHPDRYVAIHCAYGFNRTGFVVCSYLCQACGMSVPQALESFAAARPPGVKHGKFVGALYDRYGGGGGRAAEEGGRECSRGEDAAPGGLDALTAAAAAAVAAAGGGGGQDAPSAGASRERSARSTPISISRPRSLAGGSSSRSLLHERGAQGECSPEGAGGGVGLGCVDADAAGAAGPDGAFGVRDFAAMARHLDRESGMRRETSLGLAKALHEDFGVHDSTPQRDSSLLAHLAAFEEAPASPFAHHSHRSGAASGDDEGGLPAAQQPDRPDAAHWTVEAQQWAMDGEQDCGSAAAEPRQQTEPRSSQRPPLPPNGMPASTPSPSHEASRLSGGGGGSSSCLPRNYSMDSDNQSLGFGAREALMHMRGTPSSPQLPELPEQQPPPPPPQQLGGMPRADTQSQLADLDPADWDSSADLSAAPPGPEGKAAGRRLRLPTGCRLS